VDPSKDRRGPVRREIEHGGKPACHPRGNGTGCFVELIRNAANGIYQCTEDGEFLSVNPALARMLGFDWEHELHGALLTDHDASAKDAVVVDRRLRDQETVDILRSIGVDCAQGFHIGRPRPLDDVLEDLALSREPRVGAYLQGLP